MQITQTVGRDTCLNTFAQYDYKSSCELSISNLVSCNKRKVQRSDGSNIRFYTHRELVKVLIYLAQLELENLRSGSIRDYQQYVIYSSEDCPHIPVVTNRAQLRTMLDGMVTLETIGNQIKDLMYTDFIQKKTNTCRVTGKDQVGGRGNFRLLINKEWLVRYIDLTAGNQAPQEAENSPELPKSSTIENQPVAQPNMESIHQSRSKENRTVSNDVNNVEDLPDGRQNQVNTKKEAGNKQVKKFRSKHELDTEILRLAYKKKEPIPLGAGRPLSREQEYFKRLERAKRVEQMGSGDGKYTKLLWLQMKDLLYPGFEFLPETEQVCLKLMELHIKRHQSKYAKINLPTIYKRLSRAIVMAHGWAQKKNFKFCAPQIYLALGYKGTFETVIDVWLADELKLRRIKDQSNKDLMAFQKGLAKSEFYAGRILETLESSGIHATLDYMRKAIVKFDHYLHSIEISDKQKSTIRNGFLNQIQFIQKL